MVVNLKKILKHNDSQEIKKMQTLFEQHGWCFVKLPKELIPESKLVKDLTTFFESDKSKQEYSNEAQIYGYSKVDHKEGFKLLTGSHFKDMVSNGLFIPHGPVLTQMNYLCQAFDIVSKRLIEVLDQHCVFQEQPSLSTLIEKADLPLKDEHFGMLDIVSYFNQKSGIQTSNNAALTSEVNCVAHYDPGLLSISILSTFQGLQLQDRITDQWIDGPLESNIGVIWLGEAASRITNNRLKPGIHRVIYPVEQERRLTIWYELCTTQQLENLSDKNKTEPMPGGTVMFDNLLHTGGINVRPNENKLAFLKRTEQSFGISASKTGIPYYTDFAELNLPYKSNADE